MAEIIQAEKQQSLTEIRQWDVDFSDDLLTGVTIASASAVHIPPTGSASTPNVGTPTDGVVPVQLGPLDVTGYHFLEVTATLSDGEISVARVGIEVIF